MKPRLLLLQCHILVIYLIYGRVAISLKMCCRDKFSQSIQQLLLGKTPTLYLSKVGIHKMNTLLTTIKIGLVVAHIYLLPPT